MTASAAAVQAAHEEVEMEGHIIDSLLLPKVLDEIITRGGTYEIREISIGQRQEDSSYARILVRATGEAALRGILDVIHDHGARPVEPHDCQVTLADMDSAFPEGFYSTTNYPTQVRLQGDWIDVSEIEMDCGVVVDLQGRQARCVPMLEVRRGDAVVMGHTGIRVLAGQAQERHNLFEFMASPVSSEKPKGVAVREIAAAMRRTKEARQKILAVLGPALVHTGGVDHICELIRIGFLDVLFAGNALATHDIEQAFYNTSLGINMAPGLPADEGPAHHPRSVNRIRLVGGVAQAVDKGVLTSGIMYTCVKQGIPFVLGGSVRDDGPLPEVITDVIAAQTAMRKHVRDGVGFCLMMATMLHSIATGNLLPARVKVACVDINPATVTKLMDRGSIQTVGVVSDAEPFLRELVHELKTGTG